MKYSNYIQLFTSIFFLLGIQYNSSAQCSFSDETEVRAEIKTYPVQPGKCTYLLTLGDNGDGGLGNGWDGASVDVSVAEAWPAENYKMSPADGPCKTIPIYVEDGQTIDITYWNGAFETEHSMTLYTSVGDIVAEVDFVGETIPANQQIRIKAICPSASCNDSVEATFVAVDTLGMDTIFYEIIANTGATIASVGPGIAGIDSLITSLDKCQTYTLVFGNANGNSNWNDATLTILAEGYSISPIVPIPSDFVGATYTTSFTLPCPPEVSITDFTVIDCDEMFTFSEEIPEDPIAGTPAIPAVLPPLITPEVCPNACNLDCLNPVTVYVLLNEDTIGYYEYDNLLNTGGFILTNAVSVSAGNYDLTYELMYNCDSVMVNQIVPIRIGTEGTPVMVCHNLVSVPLIDCMIEVTPEMVLMNLEGCPSEYEVSIDGGSNIIDGAMANDTYPYTVTHITSGSSCSGEIEVSDNAPPVMECNDYMIECTHPNAMDHTYSVESMMRTDEQVILITGTVQRIGLPSIDVAPLGEIVKGGMLMVELDHSNPSMVRVSYNGGVSVPVKEEIDLVNELGVRGPYNTFDPTLLEIKQLGGIGKLRSANLVVEHGFPIASEVTDCTSTVDNLISEMIVETNCDQSEWIGAQIIRIFQSIDETGQDATCTQTVTLKAPTMDALTPPDNMVIECDGQVPEDITPEISGLYTFGGFELTEEHHSLCDVSFAYDDIILPTCGRGFKILRDWTVINWCSGVTKQHQQIIEIKDTEGPIIAQDSNITINIGSYDCSANVSINNLDLVDDCSGIYSVAAEYYVDGQIIIVDLINGGALQNLPLGGTLVTLIAKDSCLNTSTETITLDVIDNSGPVAICDDVLNISLGSGNGTSSSGEAWLYAHDVDEGSYDNCGPVTLEVRRPDGRLGDDWSDSVPFDCADVDSLIIVELRVTDIYGNTNVCWQEVLVEDNLSPYITCPDDLTINCDDPYALDPFNEEATAIDNCSSVTITSDDSNDLDACGAGTLTRTWTAEDASSKTQPAVCSQTITIVSISDFSVQFPADVSTNDCTLGDTDEPIVIDDDCELIAIASEDMIFEVVTDACYKIQRTWTIINWCVYEQGNPENTPLGIPLDFPRTYKDDGDGYFQYVQTIKVTDDQSPEIENPDDETFCNYEDCDGEATMTITGSDPCTDEERLEYSWSIDIDNNGSFEMTGTGKEVSDAFPNGNHMLRWTIADGCGNATSVDQNFSMIDCKNPTPVCLNGITVPGMNTDGSVEIWASDLLEYAFDNCTDAAEVEATAAIRRLGDTENPTTSITLTCDDITDGVSEFVEVEIWVTDEAGNTDYCVTYIGIQDNSNICEDNFTGTDAARIEGHVETEHGNMVEEVMIDILGTTTAAYPTGTNGNYSYPLAVMGGAYSINPSKDNNPLNGVSTYDLVVMNQHILGINSLDTPYEMIAADVNNDGNISTFDVVQTRQLILHIINDFPNNTSWRFIDMNYVFPNPTNPWTEAFPETINYDALSQDELATNFIGVKTGDVDGSAQANSLESTESRFVHTINWQTDEQVLNPNESFQVDFRASDFKAIKGYQFTLNFDNKAISFTGMEAGSLNITEDNFGFTMLDEGVITTSFYANEAISAEENDILFSLHFQAHAQTHLSDVLSLNSRYTKAEAYNKDAEILDLSLSFITNEGVAQTGNHFELYQNYPNPFSGATSIGFNLPTASAATLKVFDVSGKTITIINGDYSKGYNEISINSADLNTTGIFYYQLDTPNDSAIKKMIIFK